MIDEGSKRPMSATTTVEFPIVRPTVMPADAGAHVRRRISREAGRALEILGHAIEYLTDEYLHQGGLFSAHDPELEGVQLLMALNRQIYFACPVAPSLTERFRALLHGRLA